MFSTARLFTSGFCALGIGAAVAAGKTVASARSFTATTPMGCAASANDDSWRAAKTIYDFTVKDINGKDIRLKEAYEGKVVLVVNVASK